MGLAQQPVVLIERGQHVGHDLELFAAGDIAWCELSA
jgi:hypothetical protein